ncbi:glycosyltransferase family 4 protein [Alkalihalobacterium sp. APHAB7]
MCHLKKQKVFIKQVEKTNLLHENQKNFLIAMAYSNLKIYEKAWDAIKDVPIGDDNVTDKLKGSILYNLRDIDGVLKLSETLNLNELYNYHQKKILVKFTFLKQGPRMARQLSELFAQGNFEEFFIECIDRYKKLEGEPLNWEEFTEKHLFNDIRLKSRQDMEKAIQWLRSLSPDQRELGIILLMQEYEAQPDIYSMIIEELYNEYQKGEIQLELSQHTWKLIALSDYALKRKKYRLALNLIIKAYKEGERSPYIKQVLMSIIPNTKIKQREVVMIQRLVDDGFISLVSQEACKLMLEVEGFYHLYNGADLDIKTVNILKRIVRAMKKLPEPKNKEALSYLLEYIVDQSKDLKLDEELVDTFSTYFKGHNKWEFAHLRWCAEQGQMDEIFESLSHFPEDKQVKLLLFLSRSCYEEQKLKDSLELTEKAHALAPKNVMVLRRLIAVHHRMGNISKRYQFLEELRGLSGKLFGREYDLALDEKNLFEEFWSWNGEKTEVRQEDKILHVLNKSLPTVNGYTIRSKEIVNHQKNIGLQPVVVTKLGWPLGKENPKEIEMETIDDVSYYRLNGKDPGLQLNKVPMSDYFDQYAHYFSELVQQVKPRLIHAASNFQNALPALEVAKAYEIPSVYEVRGLWHYTQSSKTEGFENSERFKLHEKYELRCCEIATHVVAIGISLKEHLIELGVPESKISIVPNGVDTKHFVPIPVNEEIQKQYNLKDQLVFGFIGSVTEYEGLDFLLRAFAKLREKRSDVKFLLVGDGPALNDLKALTKELKLTNSVIFTGRVPHEKVNDYYSVVDVFPFPRTKAKVCELVTPLKPYEAMAMGKLVLVSDIPALKEMVTEKETGMIFEAESVDSLLTSLEQVEEDSHLAENGRQWVVKNRDWGDLSYRYKGVYSEAGGVKVVE